MRQTNFLTELRKAGVGILEMKNPLLVFHDDADGAAAAAQACDLRAAKGLKTRFLMVRYEDAFPTSRLRKEKEIIFVDFGASVGAEINKLRAKSVIVLDHHAFDARPKPRRGLVFVNPHDHGLSGSFDVCGASMVFHALKQFRVRGLARIAVVGIAGDMQDRQLSTLNEAVIIHSVREGGVERVNALRAYDSHAPLFKFLRAFPFLSRAGLSNAASRKRFLKTRQFDANASYNSLPSSEQARLANAVAGYAGKNVSEKELKTFFGERVLFKDAGHAVLGEAGSFSSFVNGWTRAPAYSALQEAEHADAALRILSGDQSRVRDGLKLLLERDKSLRAARRFVKTALQDKGSFYLVDGEGVLTRFFNAINILSTSLAYSLPEEKPVLVLGSHKGSIEVEARGTRTLTEKGLNWGAILREAKRRKLCRTGGGHAPAAGASGISPRKKQAFLRFVGEEVVKQLKK